MYASPQLHRRNLIVTQLCLWSLIAAVTGTALVQFEVLLVVCGLEETDGMVVGMGEVAKYEFVYLLVPVACC